MHIHRSCFGKRPSGFLLILESEPCFFFFFFLFSLVTGAEGELTRLRTSVNCCLELLVLKGPIGDIRLLLVLHGPLLCALPVYQIKTHTIVMVKPICYGLVYTHLREERWMFIWLSGWTSMPAVASWLPGGIRAGSMEPRAWPLMLKNIGLSVIIVAGPCYSAFASIYGLNPICNHNPYWIHGSVPVKRLLF